MNDPATPRMVQMDMYAGISMTSISMIPRNAAQ